MRKPNRLEKIESSIYEVLEHLKEKDDITLMNKARATCKLYDLLSDYKELKYYYNGEETEEGLYGENSDLTNSQEVRFPG